ncbi:MAG: radical SAM protein [candidate division Zixibacteria bacterium]|nr:radical SAM protein [candidate division Zixibacteria bacterium]
MRRLNPSEIIRIGKELYDSLSCCQLCPMDCRVNRLQGKLGKCESTAELKVASFNLHFGEEPPLSGSGGSGTIFLSHCSLFCKYCQNYPISQLGNGRMITIDEFKKIMLNLQKRGAENINFVTPDHMLPMILIALGQAKQEGLKLPIVYNCSGYQKQEILKLLNGIIDIYLVDMRYNDDNLALQYSGCHNYTSVNRAAVKEMFGQAGNLRCNRRKLAQSGVIVRHLVLPENISGSEGIFKFLSEEVSSDLHISLMSQYFPAYKAADDLRLARRITPEEYRAAREAFYASGLHNGYIQEREYETA